MKLRWLILVAVLAGCAVQKEEPVIMEEPVADAGMVVPGGTDGGIGGTGMAFTD